MIEIQYSNTALLLLVNPCITPVQIKNCLNRTSTIKVATMKITDDFQEDYCEKRCEIQGSG